ncbi:conserved hypothetical protein [Culex quinquefasciatus]|uniref:Uncharacterized protein n=1 Tax=Culex quinquefasciatus TaxID=7176 RepID=B0XLB3_CULQU|nr:conserved hypothetical protein [Culex quinquefasciatus]|eukprot:XP_001870435.1 conserved hypothetical protein [Culex quinquefasciatus]
MNHPDRFIKTEPGEQAARSIFPLQLYAQMNHLPSTSKVKSETPTKRKIVAKAAKVTKKPKVAKKLPNLKQAEQLFNSKRSQYIKRHQVGKSGENLPYSGKFEHGGVQWNLHSEGCLLTSGIKFVAQVSVEKLDELDRTNSFQAAKQVLLKNLKGVRVLLDEYLMEEEGGRKVFDKQLKMVFANAMDDLQSAEDLYQLDGILKCGKLGCQKVGAEVKKNKFMSEQTKQIISDFIEMESRHTARSKMINMDKRVFGNSESGSFIDILKQSVQFRIRIYKDEALETTPEFMGNNLEKINDCHVLFVKRKDLELFSNLSGILRNTKYMNSMTQRYFKMIKSLQPNQLRAALPTTNHILFFLCKSLSDIVKEVVAKTSCRDIAQYIDNGWHQINVIPWNSTPSTLERCLEHQIKMLLKLMNHFDVGRSTSMLRFPYAFKSFGDIESNPEFAHVIEQANKVFGRPSSAMPLKFFGKYGYSAPSAMPVLPDELRVWICLLDDTITEFFSNNQYILKLCSALLKLFLLGQLTVDSMESFRVITHNTIRLLAQAGSFMNPQNDQDSTILMKQIDFLNRTSLGGKMTVADYRDVIEVFAHYWKQRNESIDGFLAKLPGNYFKRDCIAEALDKKVELADLKRFCLAFESLLSELHNLPLDWFVRLPSIKYNHIFTERQALTVVENSWQCFRVKDPEKFINLYTALFEEAQLPPHFTLVAIKSQLNFINNMMVQKHWSNGRELTELDQLKATMGLMELAKCSVSYCNMQPEFTSFDRFLEKCTEPFASVSSKSTSLADLEVRVRIATKMNGRAGSRQMF